MPGRLACVNDCAPRRREVAGEVIDGVVQTPFGVVSETNGLTGAVDVVVRPEAIELSPDATSSVEVGDIRFLGDRSLLMLHAGAATLRAKVPGRADALAEGMRVRLRMHPTGTFLFKPRP